eukprot:5722413-Amphidinium_carterae.2
MQQTHCMSRTRIHATASLTAPWMRTRLLPLYTFKAASLESIEREATLKSKLFKSISRHMLVALRTIKEDRCLKGANSVSLLSFESQDKGFISRTDRGFSTLPAHQAPLQDVFLAGSATEPVDWK